MRSHIFIAGFTAAAVLAGCGSGQTRQDEVAERGRQVMPFDLDRTTHVFDPTETGGVQTVVADDPADATQIALIREHLIDEVERFREGDFGDPASIHGRDMPGLAVLEQRARAITFDYADVPTGGRVMYRTDDHDVVTALHQWFAAQIEDHGDHATGDHATG